MLYVLLAVALLAIGILGAAAYTTRLAVFPPRQPIWEKPAAPFEDVTFHASDGVLLRGWILRPLEGTPEKGSGVVMVHGWPWNRLGTRGKALRDLPTATPVHLLPLAEALRGAGHHVMMFDLRNHGESETARPMSIGWMESLDVVAAADRLAEDDRVDPGRLGILGFSLGANAVMYALPYLKARAAILVQPLTAEVFVKGFGRDLLGPLWNLVDPFAGLFYRILGGMQFSFIDPTRLPRGFGGIPVLYVQGSGDRWGSESNVAAMAAATPNAPEPLFPKTTGRYGGYEFVLDHPDVTLDFMGEHLSSRAP